MAQGAFIVSKDLNNPRDIHFQVSTAVNEITEDQQQFADEVHRTLTVIQNLFLDNDPRFLGYYNALIGLCQFAVVGSNAQPTHGLRALATFKADVIAREGGRIKNNYMKKLGLNALLLCLPSIIAICLFLYSKYPFIDLETVCFFALWGGCMVGVWLSFGARKTTLSFESLHILEEDRLEPVIRLIFAGLLTLTLGLLFTTEVVSLTLGKLLTTNISKDLRVALLIGIFCGISEQALSITVTEQAAKLLKFNP